MIKGKKPKVYIVFAIFLVWAFSAIACNFPFYTAEPKPLSEDERLGTLVAEMYPTRQAQLATLQVTDLARLPSSTGTEVPSIPTSQPEGVIREPVGVPGVEWNYLTQPGDTLSAVAQRFGVEPEEVRSNGMLDDEGLLAPGKILQIPNVLETVLGADALLPDSEILYSPSVAGFDTQAFIQEAGGLLSAYGESIDGEWFSGAEIVGRVAIENSVNPRVLLSFLEYRSGWVYSLPTSDQSLDYPIGFYVPGYKGLYKELSLAAKQLNIGYYGWRSGQLTELVFPDGTHARLDPRSNPGTVGVLYLFSKLYQRNLMLSALSGQDQFLELHEKMFGDPWARAASAGPIFPQEITQPFLELPFGTGERWSLTAGPHSAWITGTPRGALDFAPVTGEPECAVSKSWVRASAPGLVARSDQGVIALDLDGDGFEGTGWVVLYLHIAGFERVPVGTHLNTGDRIGHPSCEGGTTTGTHVHITRKYNGEWIPADGPLPFILSGWEAHAGERNYEGTLTKADQVIVANPGGSSISIIVH
jgi:murein DD-endopeptidase MepM/ murein hydrolase activator NlpD